MWEDRRSQARYPCLITGEMRPTAGGFSEVVCTSISRGGAFLSCKNPPPVGAKLIVELRPQGASGPVIEASGDVAWSSPRGAVTPPGCGLRWNSLRSSSGAAALRAFAAEYLRWSDLGDLPIDPIGSAWLRVDRSGKLSGAFIAEMASGSAEAPASALAIAPETAIDVPAIAAAELPAPPPPPVSTPVPAPIAVGPAADLGKKGSPEPEDQVDLFSVFAAAAFALPADPAPAALVAADHTERPTEPLAMPLAGAPVLAGFAVASDGMADAATDPDQDLLAPTLGWRRAPARVPGLHPAVALAPVAPAELTDPGVPLVDTRADTIRQPIALGAPAQPKTPALGSLLGSAARTTGQSDSGFFLEALAGQRGAIPPTDQSAGRHGTNPGTGAVLPTLAPLSSVTARMEAVDLGLWDHTANPDSLLEELSGGITALPELAVPPPIPEPEPYDGAPPPPKSLDEQTFAYGSVREALMAQVARARVARAAESGLVPLVPSGARTISAGYAPAAAWAPQVHGDAPHPPSPLQPIAAHPPHPPHLGSHGLVDPPHPRTEPGVALRHGEVQPVLQQWPAGVPRALAARYKDLQILGQGGHGVVYRARDTALDRYVVLKLMMQSTLGTEMARRYFQREVRLAASLNHANIVHIYDVGEAEGVLWYAMEFVDGVPLAQYLQPGKPLPDMSFIYSVFSQLCEALDHAHSQGILHRDVKPDNVLVAADGTVKLFDFGLARGADQGFGEQSLLLGTPYYMAPEQLSGGKVTHATDAYALGVLLYRLLAGEVPFHKGNVFAAHVLEPVPDPRKLQRGIPDGAVAVVMRLLAKRGEDRYPDCRQAAVELWQACFG